jgi:uncharacterized protein
MPEELKSERRSKPLAFGAGALIGTLGGLIGLGGAEFRLPLLISLFRFRGLEAVILNKAASLVVVATALPFRASTVPFVSGRSELAYHHQLARWQPRGRLGRRGMGNQADI